MNGGRLDKLAGMARRFGWIAALRVGVLWVLRQACGYRKAVVYSLDVTRVHALDQCARFTWKYAKACSTTPATWDAFGIEPDEQTRLARDGDFTFGATLDGRPCYFSAVSKRGFTVPDRLTVQLTGTRCAYVGQCQTLEEFRGMGLYPRSLTELALHLKHEQCERLYLYVESDNLPSIHGVTKAGFRPVGVCTVVRWRNRVKRRWKEVGNRGDLESLVCHPVPLHSPV